MDLLKMIDPSGKMVGEFTQRAQTFLESMAALEGMTRAIHQTVRPGETLPPPVFQVNAQAAPASSGALAPPVNPPARAATLVVKIAADDVSAAVDLVYQFAERLVRGEVGADVLVLGTDSGQLQAQLVTREVSAEQYRQEFQDYVAAGGAA